MNAISFLLICLGWSPFFDLTQIYDVSNKYQGFDIVRDTLFDPMHVLFCHGIHFLYPFAYFSVGLVQNLQVLYNANLGVNTNLDKEARMPCNGGVCYNSDKIWLDQQLVNFPKTSAMKAARFPISLSTQCAKFKGYISFLLSYSYI